MSWRSVRAEPCHFEIGLGGGPRIAFDDRFEKEYQRFAHRLVKLARVSEIEKREPPVGQNENIAGMRVGWCIASRPWPTLTLAF